MNWRNVVLIFRREVLDQLRDRRTLFMVAVLPMLLYPLLGIGTAQMTTMFAELPRTVVILGAAQLPTKPLLNGNRFSAEWFHSASDSEKLNVVNDLGSELQTDAESMSLASETPTAAPDREVIQLPLVAKARQLRARIIERQKIESDIAAARSNVPPDDVTALEKQRDRLSGELTTLFDHSGIQVLVSVPRDFGRNLVQRQSELAQRTPAADASTEYARPVIIHNSADEKSEIAYRRVRDVMSVWERSILKEQLRESQLPETLMSPVNAGEIDLAERNQIAANVWSKIFPALLVIMTLTGAFYPAVDLCAGEKERGTMETLLICPAKRSEIVLGKFLTVLVFSMSTAILNLSSVGMTGKYMASLAMGGNSRLGDLSLPPLSSLVWVVVILVPLATLFSALCLAIATFARSSKEGQYYLTPLLMVTLGLTMFCLSPGNEMHPFYSVMPVIGPGLLLKGLLKANGPDAAMYVYVIPVLMTSFGYSLLALWWAIEQFGSEDVLFRESERFDLRLWVKHLLREKEPVPTFAEAGFCFLMIVLLQLASWKMFQMAIQGIPGDEQGLVQIRILVVQQITLIAMPALMMGILLTTSLRRTFSLRWPEFDRLVFALLLPFALHPLSLELLVSLQWFFPPLPAGIAETMGQLKSVRVELVLAAFALTPAICEEIAFRGFLLSGFRRKGRIRFAILLSSCAFGIIHMIPHQVFNATLLGLILGAMCVRSQSLLPGIAFHFVYNSLGILHGRFGDEIPTQGAWGFLFRIEDHSLRYQSGLLVVLSVVAIGLLYGLLRPSAQNDESLTTVSPKGLRGEAFLN